MGSWKNLLPGNWGSGNSRVHMDSPDAVATIADAVARLGSGLTEGNESILLLCIGTDRSIGDSLGPLVGTMLKEQGLFPFDILGTLDNPVHATNLKETLDWIDCRYRRPLVVAVDACLGRAESVGVITVGQGALKPGAGVNKSLPAVGQMHITGVVNVGGFMEYFVLQNTRLSLIMRMARVVAEGVAEGLGQLADRIGSTRGTSGL